MSSTTLTVHAQPLAGAGPPTTGEAVRAAVAAMLPIAVSVVPFGVVLGVAVGDAGGGAAEVVATLLVYAGSSQLAAMGVLGAGGGVTAAVVAGVLVNLRLLLYAADLGRGPFAGQPRWFRVLGSLTVIDQTYGLVTGRDALATRTFRARWLTLGSTLGVAWVAAVAVGTALRASLPLQDVLHVAAPAVIVGLLVPALGDARQRRAALTAALVAPLGHLLPSGLGIVVAIVVAVVTAAARDEEVVS